MFQTKINRQIRQKVQHQTRIDTLSEIKQNHIKPIISGCKLSGNTFNLKPDLDVFNNIDV